MPATETEKQAARRRRRSRVLREDDPWLLQRLVESIHSGLIVLDGDDRVVVYNAAAESITGFPRDAVRGRPLADGLGTANRDVLLGELERRTSRLENREVTLVNRDGAKVPIGYTSSPLVDEDARAVGTVIIFKDLTEIVSLRQEMNRREHMATVGEMTALIAHEIRNPLAAMHTAAETLKSELGYDQEKEEYLDIIIREIKRVASLVSDFFAYVRPVEPKLDVTDVHELLDLMLFIEGGKMRKAGVAVSCRYAPDLPLIRTDRNLLQQVLLNVLLNAFQATSVGGSVEVTTDYQPDPAGPVLKVAVKDTGEGIDAENVRRIFQPFYSTRTKGIGLGLAITERIVRALGGRIEVESEKGRGSSFTLVLPVTVV